MKKRRIVLLIDLLGPGGAQRQIVGLATFLREKGYDVEVVFYHKNLFYADNLKKAGVAYHYLEKAENNIRLIPVISKYIRDEKPDVVIAYLALPSICACIARLFNKHFRLIVSERNTSQKTGIYEIVRFNLFRKADYVVPNAFSQAAYINDNFPKLSSKVVTIPNFVDLEYFKPSASRKRREVPEVMVAASIWAPKNTLGFIDAVIHLKEKGFKFHVSWYGLNKDKIDYINQCYDKINNNNVSGLISLKEKTTQIRDRYQEADYFCLPSFYEGTPNVICEAMACGLPVVCSDVCDNSKYVVDGENGFLFNPRDVDTMVSAFEKLLSLSEEEYQSFCQYSRMQAEKKLSKERFVNDYIKLIEE